MAKPAQPTPKRKVEYLSMAGFVGLCVLIGSLTHSKDGRRRGDAEGAEQTTKTFELALPRCDTGWQNEQLAAARRSGVVAGELVRPVDVYVLVRPLQWAALSLEQRESLGLAEACHLSLKYSGRRVHFRDDIQGRDLMVLGGRELIALARSRTSGSGGSGPVGR